MKTQFAAKMQNTTEPLEQNSVATSQQGETVYEALGMEAKENPEVFEIDSESSGTDERLNSVYFFHELKSMAAASVDSAKRDTVEAVKEIHGECFGCLQTMEIFEVFDSLKENWRRLIYNPYLPAFHKPGWLLDYALGPFNAELLGNLTLDFWAGVTVALTLIPQVFKEYHFFFL